MARGAMISTKQNPRNCHTRKPERIPDVVDFRATWDAYHLNKSLCEEQLPPQPKVKNCRHNPLCIHRLGLEKWDKLLKSKNQDFVKHEYTPRDPATQPCGLVNVGNSCYATVSFRCVSTI
ncbi:hypothetical protein L596_029374 [Steinernema carpocapsae]|uniref:Peptidase C19 ubiquitin carboxyl-terminal hydrolase domain-containing protein n=1 Tax=Steinernema carpocapsae TaxID=34508 RepID=A0A4V5ZXG7_STECR|nr:hypothetical protein L596_029374 [Steinernema carpocapsae]